MLYALGPADGFVWLVIASFVLPLPIATRVVYGPWRPAAIAAAGAISTLIAALLSWWIVLPTISWLITDPRAPHPSLAWTRSPENASAIETLAAAAQVVLGIGLLAFTWFAYRLSTATARRADRERLDATLPVIILKPSGFSMYDQTNRFQSELTVLNGGSGPALSVAIDWMPATEGSDVRKVEVELPPQPTALAAGDSLAVMLRGSLAPVLWNHMPPYGQVTRDEVARTSFMRLGRIQVRYADIHGRSVASDSVVEFVLADPEYPRPALPEGEEHATYHWIPIGMRCAEMVFSPPSKD